MGTRAAIGALALLFVALWALYGVPLQNLAFDPSFYYAHIRSPVVDGDLDFANEGIPASLVASRTRTGLVPSVWSVGPALAWAPFFLLAHGLALAARSVGLAGATDGYTALYLTLTAIGSAFWGWLGVVCCYVLARRVAAPWPALLATVLVWLASPLFFYMYRIPLMAHAPTVAAVGGLLCVWLYVERNRQAYWPWLLLGLLIGLAALMRWQNALFALIVPFALLPRRGIAGRLSWRGAAYRLAIAAAGAILGFCPQIVVWWRLYGRLLAVPQGGDFFHWGRAAIVPLLFGSNRGLFVWQPVAQLGMLGFLLYCVRNRVVGGAVLLVVALETYLNSIVTDWWGGGGFGPRRFDWLLPILALGSALIFDRIWSRSLWRFALLGAAVLLIAHQMVLAKAFYYAVMPDGQAFPFDAYNQGRPLPAGFFSSAIVGVARCPTFLVMVAPAIWSRATPLWHELLRATTGAATLDQLVASCIALLLAAALAWVACRCLPAALSDTADRARLARYLSILSIVFVVCACIVFAVVGR